MFGAPITMAISGISVVNPRFIGPIIFFRCLSHEIHIFLWWIPGNRPFSHEISMKSPIFHSFFPWNLHALNHHATTPQPAGSSLASSASGSSSAAGIFTAPTLEIDGGDFGERRNGENTIDRYIYTYVYIYNSKNRYILKKLSWYIIFLQWYITINGIPL